MVAPSNSCAVFVCVCVHILIAYCKSKVIGCILMHSFLTILQICGKAFLQMGITCIHEKKLLEELAYY